MFFDPHPDEFETEVTVPNSSPMHFSWNDTQGRLEEAEAGGNGAGHVEIALGDPALETMALSMIKLKPGLATPAHKTTANNVFGVVQGEGATDVEGETLHWKRGDVIVVPSWQQHAHHSNGGAVLFRATDEPVMKKLGFMRDVGAAQQ
jgi:gentisate 1,2-dioxygenase